MKVHELAREEVFRRLVTSESGLTEEEARRRLQFQRTISLIRL
ncbi:MAG: hypothetical protein HY316_05135 [Acidobacteria bacterium]|nr:hypothetical protein [Acidobacteriota bacterium]